MSAILKKEVIGGQTLILGDFSQVASTLKPFDLVICDPPYFQIKGGFDWKWKTRTDYLRDVEDWARLVVSLTKETSTVYWFGDDKNIAYTQVILDRLMGLLNSLVWYKVDKRGGMFGASGGDRVRSFPICSERVLMYSNDAYNLTSCVYGIRDYIRSEIEKAHGAVRLKEVNKALGTATNGGGVASACLSLSKSEPSMFTREMYEALQAWCHPHLRREYEDLRREYEDLRREYNNKHNLTEILEFPCETLRDIEHPTVKPLRLISALTETSSRPSNSVLDPFMGSGTTLVACQRLGRIGTGIELDPDYFKVACERVHEAWKAPDLFIEEPKALPPQQLGLLDGDAA
jgi:site-specific DNA-methyltransferase (adenine-specific)